MSDLGEASRDDLVSHSRAWDGPGHYVALMISPGDAAVNWTGNYHWARCNSSTRYDPWSQKDYSDQMTNFDLAGQFLGRPAPTGP